LMERSSGILMHISSLPSRYGIGTLGEAAYRYADFLKKAGQKYWQVLPIGPTGCGDSPYQSFSTYARNPYFIDLELLAEQGLLSPRDYEGIDWGEDPQLIDYGKLYEYRYILLRKAFEKGFQQDIDAVEIFKNDNQGWLGDYALFMALKCYFNMLPWNKWPDKDAKLGTEAGKEKYSILLRNDVDFWIYVQYLFYRQWNALKQYVNSIGIKIIGDVPIYVAEDSADIWANPDIFWLDNERNPICVAGCPPDYFSETGQLWGNPLYDWASLRRQDTNGGYAGSLR
jgi:4-alpha-glucanotransferase